MERINKQYGYVIIILILICITISMERVMAEDLFQEVMDTKHDFTISNEEACQYCHLEDIRGGEDLSIRESSNNIVNPLWNPNQDFTSFTIYSPVSSDKSSSIACMSCHDGLIAEDIHRIDKNLERQQRVRPEGEQSIMDHPTSIPYPRLIDGTFRVDSPLPAKYQYWSVPDLMKDGIKIPTDNTSSYIDLENKTKEIISFYAVRTLFGKVECDSCHNPHSNKIEPFLRADPEKLCLTCHDK